jgi:hypothetical protein
VTALSFSSFRSRPVGFSGVGFAFGALVTVASGAALVTSPRLALIPVFAVLTAGLLASAQLRILLVIFGGLLALQSSQSFSLVKLAYLILVGIAALGALGQRVHIASPAVNRCVRPLLAVSAVVGTLVLVASVVAISGGTPVTNVIRDASPYVLLAATPLFAIDAATHARREFLVRVFVVAGILAALSFAVSWIERRHLASLPITRLLFPSTGLAVAIIAYAFAAAQESIRRRGAWLALGGVLIALLLLTGTRTNLLVFVVPLAMTLASRPDAARIVRLGLRVVVVGLIIIVTSKAVGTVGGVDVTHAAQRLASVSRIFHDQVASQSLNERVQESHLAWRTFRGSPLLGVGLGHTFVWRDQFGAMHSSFTLDSSFVFLAKFGLLGVSALILLVITAFDLRRRLPAKIRGGRAYLALLGYASFWLISLPLNLPFEDKGFGLAMIALLALLLSTEHAEAVGSS